MKQLIIFDNAFDIKKYVLDNSVRKIGSGWEGTVYLTPSNNTLKLFKDNYKVSYNEDILMASDLNLKSFVFPDELFICDNQIYGYKAKYFFNDIFNSTKKDKFIDLEKLLIARRQVLEDIKVLTQANYRLRDISNNILFDNNNLAIIDTLSYDKKSVTLDENIELLDDALNLELMDIDLLTCALHMPFEDKIKRLINKNKGNIFKY